MAVQVDIDQRNDGAPTGREKNNTMKDFSRSSAGAPGMPLRRAAPASWQMNIPYNAPVVSPEIE
ncbi:MAG TPA: hypothetical protein VMT94_08840 [Burkholderiales bacterium]|nr:hypothetical protein [Burkholderiales bacterium]